VLYDEHQVLPVSSLIDDFIGIKDVCLSVPSVVNRNGVQRGPAAPFRTTPDVHQAAVAAAAR